MKEYEHTFKLLLFGDGGVGKTSLVQRYLTIGVEFYDTNFVVADTRVKLQIWDFSGEERFRFLLPRICQGASGGLFLYDMTALATLQHLQDWLQVILENAPGLPVIVVGTKADLVEKRKVAREVATRFAKALKMAGFAETSAKTGLNINGVFETITRIIIQREVKKKLI